LGLALGMKLSHALFRCSEHGFISTELDRVSRTSLGTRWFLPHLQTVVAHGAILSHAKILNRHGFAWNVVRPLRTQLLELLKHVNTSMIRYFLCFHVIGFQGDTAVLAAFNNTKWTTSYARTAAIAHIILDHDGAELSAEQRTRWAHIQTSGIGAVLAHIGRHQPPESIRVWRSGVYRRGSVFLLTDFGHAQRDQLGAFLTGFGNTLIILLNKRHVPPRVCAQGPSVVIGITRQVIALNRVAVPFLTGNLTGFTADAH